MFAFTKKQKQRKLYNKSYELYTKLAAEYANKADDILAMPEELQEVTNSQYELDLNKLAANFDLVRDSIEDIGTIRSESDAWKFRKTAHSEGRMYDVTGITHMVFNSYQLVTCYSSPAFKLRRAIDALTSDSSEPKLIKHVRNHVLKSLRKRLTKCYANLSERYDVVVTSPEEVSIVKSIWHSSNYDTANIHYGDTAGLSDDFLPRVAKQFKTNILVVDV